MTARIGNISIMVLAIYLLFGIASCSQSEPVDAGQTFTASWGNSFLNQTSTAQPSTQSSPCDESLWNHIFNPQRLQRIENCKTVSGTVTAIKKQLDGGFHIRVTLDPQYSSMLNKKNFRQQHGDLVVEPICIGNDPENDKDACAGFNYSIFMPRVGDHVKAVGDYVLDTEHGWNELHPAYSIELD